MAIKKIKIEYLPEQGEYKPLGTLGKHKLFVIKKYKNNAIVKDYNGIICKIKDGALYNCGSILFGEEEQQARKILFKNWWELKKQEIQNEWIRLDNQYGVFFAKGGSRFADSESSKKILKRMKELDSEYEVHKKKNISVFKSCAIYIRKENPDTQQKKYEYPILGEGWMLLNP